VSALALAAFALHTARHRNPLIEPSLFKLRPFTGASIVALVFSAAFGAMLLSRVVWAQDVWHWSALNTGLSIAPGPIMVPVCSFLIAGPLIARFGAGPVIAAGSTFFSAGVAWWALAVGLRPDYVGQVLGGILLTGIGVGLTLPTLIATGAASLPPSAFATGSAVVNMFRQIGLAVGVAVLIAVLGSPQSPAGALVAYQRAWIVTAAIALAGGLVGLALLTARRRPVGVSAAAATSQPTA
jgi:MFS family permease